MQDYFSTLPVNIKSFFEKYDFVPKNKFEANYFIKSILDIDASKPFVVNPKWTVKINKKLVDKIEISRDNPFDAFIDPVWNSMNISQKFNAINMAYYYIVHQNHTLKKIKPVLNFFEDDFNFLKTKGSSYFIYNEVVINPDKILSKYENAFDFVKVIVHELAHISQFNTSVKNVKRKVDIDKLNDFEKSLYFPATCNYRSKIREVIESPQAKNGFLFKYSALNQKDYEFLKKMAKLPFEEWRLLDSLVYACHPMERASANREQKMMNQILKSTLDKYENKFKTFGYEKLYKKTMQSLNENYGYNFKDEDADYLGKLNVVLGSIKGIGYAADYTKILVDIFNTKKMPEDLSLKIRDNILKENMKYIEKEYRNDKIL